MKMTYVIMGIMVAAGLIFYVNGSGKQAPIYEREILGNHDSEEVRMYYSLRNLALNATPELLEISLPTDKTIVYGVVMDWEIDGAIVTLASYLTGDASIYYSTGGGQIGGGGHENVNSAAKSFVGKAQVYLARTMEAKKTALPDSNYVIFYLLTNKGIYSAQEMIKNFENNSSPWLPLFEDGNKVISELLVTREHENK